MNSVSTVAGISPPATVVAGGLIPATVLTLFIIPTFYFILERWAERRAPAAERAVGATEQS